MSVANLYFADEEDCATLPDGGGDAKQFHMDPAFRDALIGDKHS